MNLIDIIIVILLGWGAYRGWKYGCFSSIVSLLGSLIIFVAAFYLKNPLSELLYENMPFQSFSGLFQGITSVNILVYEAISYILCLIILATVFGIIIKVTGIVDKLLKLTFVFALPSKILGLVFGALQLYIFIFAGTFILAQLPFSEKYFRGSKFGTTILTKTPLLSNVTNDLYYSTIEIYEICLEDDGRTDKTEGDYKALEALLSHDIITSDSLQKLVDQGKITIPDVDKLIEKYKDRDANNIEEKVEEGINNMTSTTTTTAVQGA